jgi:Spy/CpxP family protein refolding chaperone
MSKYASKTMVKSLIGSLAAGVVTLCLVVSAWAMPPGFDRHDDPEKMLAKLAEKLELDDQQRESAEEIMTGVRAEGASDRERMEQLREEMHSTLTEFSAAEVQALADEVGTLTSRMVYRGLTTQSEMYALLTEEQREEFASMREHREKRRSHSRSHRFDH